MEQMVLTDIPILRKRSDPVDFEEGRKTALIMHEMLIKDIGKRGMGLSAIQIGRPQRVICLNYEGQMRTLLNPEIIKASDKKTLGLEGCLSLPFTINHSVCVPRHKRIKVKYTDMIGKVIIEKFDGMMARAIQHEMDHLNGKLIIDYKEGL